MNIMANSSCSTQKHNASLLTPDDVNEPMYSVFVTNIAICGFLCYTTITMNVFTVFALTKTSSLQKPLKTLLLNLAFSDLGVGVLGHPFQIAYLVEQLRGKPRSDATIITSDVVVTVLFLSSLSSIVAISADRFFAVQMPLRYNDVVTHKRTLVVVAVIWLFSFVFSSLCYAFQVIPYLVAFVVLILLELASFIVTTMSSCKIYFTVRHHKKQMTAQMQRLEQTGEGMKFPRSPGEKSCHGTLLIYLLFWLCYLPHLVVSIVRQYSCQSVIIDGFFAFSETLVLLNSSINPVIYCWKIMPIRRTVMSIVRNTSARYIQQTSGAVEI